MNTNTFTRYAVALGLLALGTTPLLADDWRKPGGTSNANAAPGKVIGAKLEAVPDHYAGACNPDPHITKFKGSIQMTGPGDVKYRFVRSDGGMTDAAHTRTLHFAAAGVQAIADDETWSLWGNLAVNPGWEQIEILSPNAGFKSNKAFFRLSCSGGGDTGGGQGKPDLVITAFGFIGPVESKDPAAPKPVCEPHNAVYIFRATVKNVGTAASPSSASLGNKALVQAMAQDKAGWGNGMFLNALAPGASQTVDIPVYYLMDDPGFMVNNAPHKFLGIADPLGLVNESNEGNNNAGPINMGAPAGCEKLKK